MSRSEAFDVCLCIAVLHHLSTTERRLEGLRELVRIVRPGGLVLVYVWALEQNLQKIQKKDLKEVEFTAKQQTDRPKQHSNSNYDDSLSSSKVVNTEGQDNREGETHSVQVNMKREVFEQQDLFVPWKFRGGKQDKSGGNAEEKNASSSGDQEPASENNVFHRFYHVFKEGELLKLCSCLDNVVAKDLYYDRGNWCVVLEKKAESYSTRL